MAVIPLFLFGWGALMCAVFHASDSVLRERAGYLCDA
jgi:hypothetical protein